MKSDMNMSLSFNFQNFPVLRMSQIYHTYHHHAKLPDPSISLAAVELELVQEAELLKYVVMSF